MDFIISAILQGLCFSSMAIGVYLSMRIFNIPDITTDGSYTVGAAVTATLLTLNWNPFLVFPVVVLVGSLAGAMTGLIHTKLKVHPILAGILVMISLYSINLKIMGRSNIPLINSETLLDISVFKTVLLNESFWIVLVVFLIVMKFSYLLKTDFGLTMRATGNNEKMIQAIGVRTDNIKIVGLALANTLTATSGYLMTQYQRFADINMGVGIVIVGLGSVMIAEVFIVIFKVKRISIKLLMVVIGTIIFQMALAMTLMIGIDPIYLKLFTALFVLLIVSLPKFGLISFKI
jgi:putative ABC transport system permease protein